MQSHRPCWTGTKGKMTDFLDESSLWTKPGLAHTNQTWNANQLYMETSRFSSSKESAPYIMCCEGDVHCGVWYWCGNTAPRCTSKADGKPAYTARSCSTTFVQRIGEYGDTWWYSTRTFFMTMQGPLLPLAMGDSGTSTILTLYESMRLRSLRQSERISSRESVQQKRWTYPCYRAVNSERQQRWTRWCTAPSKHFENGDK